MVRCMVKLTIHPSSFEISPYKMGDLNSIERWMSLWDNHTFQYVYRAYSYDKENKTLYLPRGIDQDRLVRSMRTKYGTFNMEDRSKFETIESMKNNIQRVNTTFKPRNNLQQKAIEFLSNKQIETRYGQKMLNLNTGEGKTFCALYSCLLDGSKPFIMMNALNLATQWKDKILEYTDITEDEVYIISGRRTIEKLIDMSNDEIKKIKFFIGIYNTVIDYINADDYRLDLTSLMYDKAKVNIKIFDEIHVHYQSVLSIDYKLSRIPSIYLTATPERNNRNEDKLFQSIFGNIPHFKSPNENGSYGRYRNVIITKFTTSPTMENIADVKKRSTRGFSYNAYNDYLKDNPSSMGLLFNALNQVYSKLCMGEKTVLLVKNIDMIETLVDLFYEQDYINDNAVIVSAYHSKINKKLKPKILEESNLIITTDSSLGKGIDVQGLTRVISCINTSSTISINQMAGRLRYIPDKELYYIDMVDTGFTDIRRQLSSRMQYYRKMAKTINEITL